MAKEMAGTIVPMIYSNKDPEQGNAAGNWSRARDTTAGALPENEAENERPSEE
jgi:hypothetical protein